MTMIASCYVRGSVAYISLGAVRTLLSVVLPRMLSMPVRDLSSGHKPARPKHPFINHRTAARLKNDH